MRSMSGSGQWAETSPEQGLDAKQPPGQNLSNSVPGRLETPWDGSGDEDAQASGRGGWQIMAS
ncbi:hypothetical protein I7I51_08567 [Histoplasma capsulatum]|uniref:Uncharacterized protein n=1 Tax=Ajellomyces capsulatus TaxID=5037 RepID=A0A8A1M0Q2_AJECA|nr:hypothetical protein I7I51_08567 [Histoplasma capsulatum]